MAAPHTETVWQGDSPMCDLCSWIEGNAKEPAKYDGRTIRGFWSLMCSWHFKTMGVGLGLGRGQQLTFIAIDDVVRP